MKTRNTKMFRHLIYSFVCCFFYQPVTAQECTCKKSFEELQLSVEHNYAGFDDKVNEKTMSIYTTLIKNIKEKTLNQKDDKFCYSLLEEYIAFYKDGHLFMSDFPKNLQENITYQDLPSGDLDNYFKSIDATKDIRGIYTTESYELAIVPHKNQRKTFVAIIISSKIENWKKGMIKMILKPKGKSYYDVKFLYSDFEEIETEAFYAGNFLDILRVGTFERKLSIKQKIMKEVKEYQSIYPSKDISFSFPDDNTAVLFLASFQNQYEKIVDSLMTLYKTELENRPNWIIDISYNSGGGTGTYQSILPYLYTNPIKRSGSYYKLSAQNIANYETFLKENPDLPQRVKTSFETYIKVGKEKPNSWYFEEGKTFIFDSIRSNPKKISVIISSRTASSGEIFLMDAKQSKKVTIFGEKTAGVVDYGDGTIFEIGCNNLKVSIPARKSAYLNSQTFDTKGIKADVVCDPRNAVKIALKKMK